MRQHFDGMTKRIEQTVARILLSLRRFYLGAILLDALDAFNRNQMTLLAAALSYYALLALFPLLLTLVGLASFFISEQTALDAVMRIAGQYLPGVEAQIKAILSQVVAARGAATLIGFVALLWSASGVFDVLQLALDRAWRVSTPRAFWLRRLFSIAVIGVLGLFFVTSVLVSAATLDFLYASLGDTANIPALQREAVNWIGIAASFGAFLLLYKIFPHARVTWRAALFGASVAALLWQLAEFGYGVYLSYFARFNLVYGSLGAVIGLMLWGYVSAAIILFCAELTARVGRAQNI